MRRKIEEYLAHLAREGYAASTIRSRRETLALFRAAGCSIGRFRGLLSRGPHRARQELLDLKRFLVFAGRESKAEGIRLPRCPRPPPKRPPGVEEVRRLLASLDGRTPISMRDRALTELVYSSGLRGCEAVRLRLGDVDFAGRTLRVRGKGGHERVVPFGRPAAEWLMRYLAESRPRLRPRDESLFVGERGRDLDVPGIRERLRPLTAHALRRAAAAHCQARGMNLREIQELLGHADLKSTARYTGFDRSELRAVLEQRHPRARMILKTPPCPGGGR